MLTRKSLLAWRMFLTMAKPFFVLPFEEDRPGGGRLIPCSRVGKLAIIYVCNAYLLLSALHIAHCFVHGVIFGTRKISNLNVDIVMMVSVATFAIWQLNLVWRREDFASLFNRILIYDKANTARHPSMKLNEVPKMFLGRYKTDGMDYLITIYNGSILPMSLLIAGLFIQKPENPRYIFYRLVSQNHPYYRLLSWLWFAWEWQNQYRIVIIFNFYVYLVIMYTVTTNYWLRSLTKTQRIRNIRHKLPTRVTPMLYRLTMATISIQNYKSQQILNGNFNDCFAPLFWPMFKFLNILNHIQTLFTIVKFHGKIPVAAFALFPALMLVWLLVEFWLYPILGEVHEGSRNYIRSWKTQLGKAGKRHFSSLFPLGVSVGSFYIMKKSTVLTVSLIVCTFSANLIVAV